MEVKNQNPAWLKEAHPNFVRWQRARELSLERGKFVNSIINQKVNTQNLYVLDLGSGEGGTTEIFSKSNFVVSLDLSFVRLKRQQTFVISKESLTEKSFNHNENRLLTSFEVTNFKLINGDALFLPFSNHSFDLIILQDVIEHLTGISDFYSEVKRVLKTDGTIYLSSPNKYSIFNFLSDPHFGLPMVSTLKRESIKKYFLKYFRKDDYNRTDIAQLFSLNEIISLFQKDFVISLNTKFSILELFKGNKGIIWSKFHQILISLCKFIKLDWGLIKIANDSFGIINKYFTPTFYFVLKRKHYF